MENKEDRVAMVRRWLYLLLADLETSQTVDAEKTTSGNKTILTIELKY